MGTVRVKSKTGDRVLIVDAADLKDGKLPESIDADGLEWEKVVEEAKKEGDDGKGEKPKK